MTRRCLLLTAVLLAPTLAQAAAPVRPGLFARAGGLFSRTKVAMRPMTPPLAPKPVKAPLPVTKAPVTKAPAPPVHFSQAPNVHVSMNFMPDHGTAHVAQHAPPPGDHFVDSMNARYEGLAELAGSSPWRAINQSVSVFRDAMKQADSLSKEAATAHSPEQAATLRLRALAAYSVASKAANLRMQLNQNAPHMQGHGEQLRMTRIAKALGVPVHMMDQAYGEALMAMGIGGSVGASAGTQGPGINAGAPNTSSGNAMFTHSAYRTPMQNSFAPPRGATMETIP